MLGPFAFIDLNSLMPTQQWHSVPEVLHQWRSDALELLRQDVPKILVVLIVSLVLLWLLRVITQRLRALSKRQAFLPAFVRNSCSTLSGVINGVGMF